MVLPKVLIVDDEEMIRESLSDFLVDSDFTVGLAESGSKGLEEVSSGFYEIAIVDMSLPDMEGEDFITKAHDINSKVKFIIHTGHSGYIIPQNILKLGLNKDDILYKPVTDIQKVIEKIIKIYSETSVKTL